MSSTASGVEQRLLLGSKGARTDILVMTATPIPRTLLLTQWNEMEVSRLTGKPGGRQPIRTTLHSLATLPDVVDAIGRALDRGELVYWVCPMVSESELTDLAAAEARFVDLQARYPGRVGLAHGQQDPAVRDTALADFAAGRLRLLVATTVVEVGVDVKEATVMVIEHADRFGLAQLHQLRGRVGRGAAQSYCLLLHDDGLTDTMRRRLTLLRDTEDGFLIADEISACAVAGTFSANGKAASRATASPTPNSTNGSCTSPPRTPPCCWTVTPN